MATQVQSADTVNSLLKAIFSNGRGEAGLEVGTDPGLAETEYIQIPLSALKRVAVRLAHKTDRFFDRDGTAHPATDFTADEDYEYDPTLGFDQFNGKANWQVIEPPQGMAASMARQAYAALPKMTMRSGIMRVGSRIVSEVRTEDHTFDAICAIIEVNLTAIKAGEFDIDQQNFILSTRVWAIISGLVTTSKSFEWTLVADPATISDRAREAARFTAEHSAQAWTAAAARTTSWRKTNHCTGGPIAGGFPQRFLAKEGMWPSPPDRQAAATAHRLATDMFYIATHAVSVHACLALMVPGDAHHWAELTPAFGIISEWDIHASTRIRMTPRTQVAGTALVVDAVTVLTMLVKEGLAPLVTNLDQLNPLLQAYENVQSDGMGLGVYARWYFEGGPVSWTQSPFSQKDPAFADLIGELAVVGTQYYAASTIAGSASLKNAAGQLADESSRAMWTALGAERRRMVPAKVMRVVRKLKGASAAAAVDKMLDADPGIAEEGVDEYNDLLANLSARLNVSAPRTINAAEFIAATASDAAGGGA